MQQDSSVLIANDNGYGAVPQSIQMRLELGCRSNRGIINVDDNHVICSIVDARPWTGCGQRQIAM
jgi:hypothetical protein